VKTVREIAHAELVEAWASGAGNSPFDRLRASGLLGYSSFLRS
jgi:hypothetical protein